MATTSLMGKITFINHDKGYASIEYLQNGKKKTINGNIGEKEQLKLKEEKIIRKIHQFHVGDEVSFVVALSARGDKMIADCIEFKFNNALDSLINKSATENRFVGYLKKVDEDYFVKETGSYIFFPLKLSPWERKPSPSSLNEPYFFKLENTHTKDKVTAAPYKSQFIPEYQQALLHQKSKQPVEGKVLKISPHGIFIALFNEKIQAKLPSKNMEAFAHPVKEGDKIPVIITYLGPHRIVIAPSIPQ